MDRKSFLEKISCAAKALKGKGGTLNLSVVNGEMEVSAASKNLCIYTELQTDCNDMKLAVKADTLIAAVERLPGDKIDLSPTETTLKVSGGKGSVMLPTAEWKNVIRKIEPCRNINVHGITPYVKQIKHSLDISGYNPLMSTINVKVYEDGGFMVTALDGKRCSIRNMKAKDSELATEFVVYGAEFDAALKLAGNGDITISIPKDGNFIHFEGDNAKIQCSLYGEPFFNVDNLCSQRLPYRAAANKSEMKEALELARLVSNKVLMDISGDSMRISGSDVSGSSDMVIPIKTYGLEGKTVNTAFNASFLLESLESIDAEQVLIHFKNAMSQFAVTDGHHAIEIVMPVKR